MCRFFKFSRAQNRTRQQRARGAFEMNQARGAVGCIIATLLVDILAISTAPWVCHRPPPWPKSKRFDSRLQFVLVFGGGRHGLIHGPLWGFT